MDGNPLSDKLKDLPKDPGVYLFKNKDGEVIYVGKAKNLKNRVSQYFSSHDNRPQLPYLMAEATGLDYTVASNELESLFLESNLIKRYMPKYNLKLRDDKNYAFITIDYSFQIPQIGYARKLDRANKQVKYFGPYSATHKIRNTLHAVRQVFPYCANKEVGSRPCFYYFLHRCPGVCVGKVTLEEYRAELDNICTFLGGHTGKIKTDIKRDMAAAAAEKQFEKAARMRDQLRGLMLLEERQNAVLTKPVSWDIVSVFCDAEYAAINLFKIREGKMADKENFVFEQSAVEGDVGRDFYRLETDAVQSFLEQYYLETSDAPRVVFAQRVADAELVSHIIQSRFSRKVEVVTPKQGKAAELVSLGITNADEHLKNWVLNQASHISRVQGALKDLQELLHLPALPSRIECYDISNIQGTNPVGSMVVMKDGLPAKAEYRKFKINVKSTPDDFAMMKEMLTRRLGRMKSAELRIQNGDPASEQNSAFIAPGSSLKQSWPTPDLIIIDGGKGQLGVAVEVLKEKGLDIPIVGLAKRIEEIFFPGNPEPLVLPHTHPALQMLQRLRDEAHRFGISFHRQLRSKQAVKSALDEIPGIGPKTKKLLKQKFGTVANIRAASFEELAAVVGQRVAQAISTSL